MRIGIKTILDAENDLEIVGEADSGAKGFELFRQLKPDVTILSLRTPDSCAIDRLDDYFAVNKKAKIIVLSGHGGRCGNQQGFEKRRARLYLQRCWAGGIDQSDSHGVRAENIPNYIAKVLSENIGQEELTKSEQRILQMIVGGMSNKEIAFALDISENTVKTHIKNIFDKIGVYDRTSAATLAIRRGLVRFDI